MVDVEVVEKLSTAMNSDNEIRGGNGGTENDAEDGVEEENEVELLDLEVMDCCVK